MKQRSMAEAAGRSQRQLRVGESLRHTLAAILNRDLLDDPVLAGRSITVSEVRVSADLANAAVFVMPLGGEALEETVTALNRASGFLQRHLAAELDLRIMPRLSFQPDRSFGQANAIDRILRRPRVRKDLQGERPDEPEDSNGTA
ncbi:MAG: 30S ribosome-binding factor RbfA [Rhodospirillales bacterium]|nr:30S ribosome-binding factor RbfA [Rhodospirillales bacterium]